MKNLLANLFLLMISVSTFGQMIMSAEGVRPDNACNPDNVYFLIENKARPVESIDSIEIKLNKLISFAKDNPDFIGTCAIQFVVNCNGQVGGGFHVVTKSGNDKLDSDLIDFFKQLRIGKLERKARKKQLIVGICGD